MCSDGRPVALKDSLLLSVLVYGTHCAVDVMAGRHSAKVMARSYAYLHIEWACPPMCRLVPKVQKAGEGLVEVLPVKN